MKTRAYIFYLVIFICGFIVAYFAGVKVGTGENNETINQEVANNSAQKETKITVDGYWIKLNNDKIFVYKSDGKTVVAETDISVSRYTDRDKQILEHGVYLENAEQLFKYLEANTS